MLFFTYGTLQKGMPNHEYLRDGMSAEYIGKCKTKEPYLMELTSDPFPYLLDSKGSGDQVYGELYELDDIKVESLDVFEGVPSLYTRGSLEVEMEETFQCIQNVTCYFKSKHNKIPPIKFISRWE